MRIAHYFELSRKEIVMIIDAFTISGIFMSLVMAVVVFYLVIQN
jgi:hypothetical protein